MNIQEELSEPKSAASRLSHNFKQSKKPTAPEFSFNNLTPEFTKNNSSLHAIRMAQPQSPFAMNRSSDLIDEKIDGKNVNKVFESPSKQKIQRSVQSQKILEQKRKMNNLAKRYVSGSSSGNKARNNA